MVFVEKPFEYTHGDFKVIDDVDFDGVLYVQIGEENVVITNSINDDPWLIKFVGKGTFIGQTDDPTTNLDVVGMKFENPLQLKNMLANYGVANGYQLCFMQNDYNKLLVYCGRNVGEGKCAAFKRKKPKDKPDHAKCTNSDIGDSSSKPDHAECSSKPATKKNGRTSQAMKERWSDKKYEKRDYKKVFRVHLGCGHLGRALKSPSKLKSYTQTISVADAIHWVVCWRPETWLMARFTLKGCIFALRVLSKGWKQSNDLLAWVVVGVENKDIWAWFLSLLQEYLELRYGGGLTDISNRHKGLLEVVACIIPNSEHRQAFFEMEKCSAAFENGISKSFNSRIVPARELGVNEFLLNQSWYNAYQYSIRPVLGSKLWKPCDNLAPLPPIERKRPGKPRKQRIGSPIKRGEDNQVTKGGSMGNLTAEIDMEALAEVQREIAVEEAKQERIRQIWAENEANYL
uniref:Uncharacterized protein n=1 Tax=Tanacetum cinerariifolium TaxID=118510 RepID=A0A6L2NUH9_TANCI|nr:hypothetical protein [Tanacetum cinerariifolium]